MGKRMLAFILTGIMLFTAVPAEVFAAAIEDTAVEFSQGQDLEKFVPKGGLEKQEAIEISDEMAEEIGIVNGTKATEGELQYSFSERGSQVYHTSWDAYSSNYLYNRLNENERKFWDLLDAECRKYLSSATNMKSQMLQDKYGFWKKYYVAEGVEFLTLGLNLRRAGNVYLMFNYSNPQYYFLQGSSYLYNSKALFPMVYDAFADGKVRKTETQEMKTQIQKMKAQVEKGANDLEKARIAHDLIIRKVTYDNENTLYHQSAYSVFCENYTVCAGYTKAFEILMNSVGIDTIGITSLDHAWNAVCLNDSWYYVDCTWDDLDGLYGFELRYTWFGISESTLTGPMDSGNSHRSESLYLGLLPRCTRDLGSTQDTAGTLPATTQITAAPQIKQKKTGKGISITLTTTTPGADIYYTTDGEEPSSSFSRSRHYTGTFTVNANVTLKAIAVCDGKKNSTVVSAIVKGRQYKVKFDTAGGSKISALNFWPQEVLKKPADPKRKNYTFAGWYTNKKYTSKWKFGSKITKDMTLYAKWTKVKVKDTAVTKLKSKSGRKLAVTIRKVNGAKGYQIRYATNAGMSSAKKVLVSSNKKTISHLRAGKIYYVQARAYKLDSKKNKVYGKWSPVKSATVRK